RSSVGDWPDRWWPSFGPFRRCGRLIYAEARHRIGNGHPWDSEPLGSGLPPPRGSLVGERFSGSRRTARRAGRITARTPTTIPSTAITKRIPVGTWSLRPDHGALAHRDDPDDP